MNFNAFDHQCMARALQLARRGLKTTHPNQTIFSIVSEITEIVKLSVVVKKFKTMVCSDHFFYFSIFCIVDPVTSLS